MKRRSRATSRGSACESGTADPGRGAKPALLSLSGRGLDQGQNPFNLVSGLVKEGFRFLESDLVRCGA
jgi:hypothetical protein